MRTIQRILPAADSYLDTDHLVGGMGENLYPYWRERFAELFDRDDPPAMVIDGAIGTGKSHLLRLAFLRVLYEVLEAGGASAYGLGADEHIHIVVCGSAHDLAELRALLGRVPYFVQHGARDAGGGGITFPGRRVRVVTGRPDDRALLGLNVAAVLADGLNGSEDPETTLLIMRGLWRRLLSRSARDPRPGLLLYVGAGHKTTDQLSEDPGVKHYRPALWDVEWGEGEREMFAVVVPNHGDPYIVPEDDVLSPGMDASVIAVPEDYRKEFEADLPAALRDFAGEPIGE